MDAQHFLWLKKVDDFGGEPLLFFYHTSIFAALQSFLKTKKDTQKCLLSVIWRGETRCCLAAATIKIDMGMFETPKTRIFGGLNIRLPTIFIFMLMLRFHRFDLSCLWIICILSIFHAVSDNGYLVFPSFFLQCAVLVYNGVLPYGILWVLL